MNEHVYKRQVFPAVRIKAVALEHWGRIYDWCRDTYKQQSQISGRGRHIHPLLVWTTWHSEQSSLTTLYIACVSFCSFSSLTICKNHNSFAPCSFLGEAGALITGTLHVKTSFPVCGCLIRVQVAAARAGAPLAAISCIGERHRTKLRHQSPWETMTKSTLTEQNQVIK